MREVCFVLFLFDFVLWVSENKNKIGQRLFVVKGEKKSNCSQPQTQLAFFCCIFCWLGRQKGILWLDSFTEYKSYIV